ncbi:MAG: hydroxyethylthiazole kinase [Pyramidobacter sp.]|nr:hydroxyethylthiazole kinase [Pyramidobacter sp.]
MEAQILGAAWAAVRSVSPLVHCITNYVTANDCANVLLACGASPVMADAPEEAEEITQAASGLCLNMGTFSSRALESMLASGRCAARRGIPVLLDPVGVGASAFRTAAAHRLCDGVKLTAVRGNASEMKTLLLGGSKRRGVDAQTSDAVAPDALTQAGEFVRSCARQLGCVAVVTGAVDIVSDGTRVCAVRNGHPMMARVTGTGCMLSALMTACLAANPGRAFEACAAALCAAGLAGQTAAEHVRKENSGTGSFRVHFIDALSRMDETMLTGGACCEML